MYASRSDLEAIIPPHFIVQALDDDADGVEDDGLFQKVSDAADRAVNAYLSGRYTTPFGAPFPDLVAEAAKIFVAESLYARRGYESDRNPYTARANGLRKQLESIGNGNGSLGGIPDHSSGTRPPMAIVTEPSRTTPAQKING
jgi:phage gp36-like protein